MKERIVSGNKVIILYTAGPFHPHWNIGLAKIRKLSEKLRGTRGVVGILFEGNVALILPRIDFERLLYGGRLAKYRVRKIASGETTGEVIKKLGLKAPLMRPKTLLGIKKRKEEKKEEKKG